MSKINWTTDQSNAITSCDNACLVSAAAGSGKTAVLVERIIRKLEITDIDRFIIVTFTEAAASQMKQSISEKLKKRIYDPETPVNLKNRFKKQLSLLADANISTMHSFCSRLIRTHFEELDISADYSIIQPQDRNLIFKEAFDEVTEELYKAKDTDFLCLVSNYCKNTNDDALFSMVEILFNASESMPFPEKWFDFSLNEFKKENLFNSVWFNESIKDATQKLKNALFNYTSAKILAETNPQLQVFDLCNNDILCVESIIKLLENPITDYNFLYENITPKFGRISIPRSINTKEAEEFKALREDFKKSVNGAVGGLLIYDKDTLDLVLDLSFKHAETLIKITKSTAELFSLKKLEQNTLDYNDLEHYTIKLLVDENQNLTPLSREISEEYDEIIIDEYQDTNPVQEVIFNAISKNRKNLFMVGDMKQSIYKFRNADPTLFTQKLDTYSENGNDNGKKIYLSQNFRSRKSILDFSNMLFGQVMNKGVGDIEYADKEMLNFGAKDTFDENDPCIDVILIDRENSEDIDITGTEKEAYIVGAQIQKMIDEGFTITDKETSLPKKATYRDFSILLRTAKNTIDIFASTLTKMGIPVFIDDNTQYLLSSYEIKVILSFLRIIDNPYDDISAAAVLKSPMFGVSDDTLAIASREDGYSFLSKLLKCDLSSKSEKIKIDNFEKLLNKYKESKTYLNSYEMIKLILEDTNFYEFAGAMSGGDQRQTNINYLLKCAKNYESDSYKGIYSFLKYIDSYDDKIASMISPKTIPDNINSVSITTIHKSKGLEYPVVILPRTGTQFNIKNSAVIETHTAAGFGFNCISNDRISYKSPAKESIRSIKKAEDMSEEMRILYVALTRAKEKLLIFGSVNKDKLTKKLSVAAKCTDYKFPDYVSKNADCFMDWICMSLVRCSCFEKLREDFGIDINFPVDILCPVNVYFSDFSDFSIYDNASATENNCTNTSEVLDTDNLFTYKYNHTANDVYSKYSVSNIKKQHYTNTNFTQHFQKINDINNDSDVLTQSQKGTLIHFILERAVNSKADTKEKLEDLINDLETNELISKRDKENIPLDLVMNFIQSDFAKKIFASHEVYTESSFEIMTDSVVLDESVKGIDILVQGVIDLYFKDGDSYVIIDYKSDKVTKTSVNQCAEEYKIQLSLYKEAVEKMHSAKNIKAYLYFLETDTFIEV